MFLTPGINFGTMGCCDKSKKELGYETVEEIAKWVLDKAAIKPLVGIICGSGLGGIADRLADKQVFKYKEIPHFPAPDVVGHAGQMNIGKLEGVPTVIFQGRAHYYEGYHMDQVVLSARVMKLMGIKVMIVTNAAGGINPNFKLGNFMLIKDHINIVGMSGNHPLRAPNDERYGVRFPSLTDLYSPPIRKIAKKIAADMGISEKVHEGVYACVAGPSYETVAELNFLKKGGADAVGMSTAHECIVGKHCGMTVFGVSLITNECILEYDTNRMPNHEEVIETGKQAAALFEKWMMAIVKNLHAEGHTK